VSVEGKVAESLKLKLGDHMVFSVGGVNREARVTSLREINWDNFQPNFFMIFQPGTLKDLPATYLTSFYLAPGHDQQIVELSRAFPAVTILQVEACWNSCAASSPRSPWRWNTCCCSCWRRGWRCCSPACRPRWTSAFAKARCCAHWAPTAVAGQGAAYRVRFARRGQRLAGGLGSEVVSLVLYRFAFDLPWHPHPWLLVLPLIGAALIGGAGVFGTRRALNASPLTVLREG
jgi:putative ABC transport system permease protein